MFPRVCGPPPKEGIRVYFLSKFLSKKAQPVLLIKNVTQINIQYLTMTFYKLLEKKKPSVSSYVLFNFILLDLRYSTYFPAPLLPNVRR